MELMIPCVELMKLDTPTRTGRVYSTELAQKIIEEFPQEGMLGYFMDDYINLAIGETPLEGTSFKPTFTTLNVKIIDDCLVGDIYPLPNKKGQILEEFLLYKCPMEYSIAGTGEIGKGGVVSNYSLKCLTVEPKIAEKLEKAGLKPANQESESPSGTVTVP